MPPSALFFPSLPSIRIQKHLGSSVRAAPANHRRPTHYTSTLVGLFFGSDPIRFHPSAGVLREGGASRTSPPMAAARRPGATKPKGGGGGGAGRRRSAWLAADGSKRWGEAFFLLYTPFWLTLCLGVVVPFKLYERFTELEYLILGLVSTVPAFLIPLFLVGKADSVRNFKDRYWVKANIWIIIFSYVGNYFWTHYFFTVLGASYTFPSWRMNNVPHTTFLLTHACFLFYHMASNMTLRRLRHSAAHLPQSIRWLFEAAWILALSYFIAYLETLAIANFPYYEFVDRDIMYKVGSLFYAIYFIVSFPMFSRIDEKDEKWNLSRVAVDSLGAAMLVTIILDLWRIFLGPIVPIPESRQCGQPGLAWFQVQNEST
ncbi:cycloeucalenol cycloisomerase [Sorghum bicolor]|nr:cycloeucalenol cycloisomerase [Sorghum bicolor]|eukprot:XP_002439200.2 cycloeucalenol cycloisomerase [Sorghum bicolor]